MKGFLTELHKAANRKFLLVFALVFGFVLLLSGWQSYQMASHKSINKKTDISFAQMKVKESESNLSGKSNSVRINELYAETLACYQQLLAAYQKEDSYKALKLLVRLDEIETEKKKNGVTFAPLSAALRQKSEDAAQTRRILYKEGIVSASPFTEKAKGTLSRGETTDGVSLVIWLLRSNLWIYLLPLVVVLCCSDALADEVGTGSIRFLLAQPVSRTALVCQKYIAGVLLSFGTLLASVLAAFIGGSVFWEPGDFRYPVKVQASLFSYGETAFIPGWAFLLRVLLLSFCAILFFAAVALLVSALCRHGLLSLIVSAGLCVGSVAATHNLVIAQQGGAGRFFPFYFADSYSSTTGFLEVPIMKKEVLPDGMIVSITDGNLAIAGELPAIAAIAILLGSTAIALVAA